MSPFTSRRMYRRIVVADAIAARRWRQRSPHWGAAVGRAITLRVAYLYAQITAWAREAVPILINTMDALGLAQP